MKGNYSHTCFSAGRLIIAAVFIIVGNMAGAQSEAKTYCDSLKGSIIHEQRLLLYTIQHPRADNIDSVQKELEKATQKNLSKVKATFYTSGVPSIMQYSYECVRYFWMIVIRAGKDSKFQHDVINWVESKGIDKYELRDDYAFVVDKRRVLDGKPQVYGTQLKIDTATKRVTFLLPIEDSGRLDDLRKQVGLVPSKEFLAQQEKIIFNRNPVQAKQ